ncbi:MAG: deoxyribodipyrimidine photo-lyase [Saprospirales bacterium]|nr:MAG: deoxyribodipyrimidine photo-lyase [Saprospirales bacterium]
MDGTKKVAVFWFRRDLRWHDNRGLYEALNSGLPVVPAFIFDRAILDELEDRDDARVGFIHSELQKMNREIGDIGRSMDVRQGKVEKVWKELLRDYQVVQVYTNRDYEPYAIQRDKKVQSMLAEHQISFHSFKDHVITEAGEVEKKTGGPYTVFTPYKNTWFDIIGREGGENCSLEDSPFLKYYPSEKYLDNLVRIKGTGVPKLEELGFSESSIKIPSRVVKQSVIKQYGKNRNFPAENGTSRLGIHFRFGTLSIREKARKAASLSNTYLNELIWRDFYSQILAEFPHVVDGPFKEKYARIEWINDTDDFKAWCEGKTGYPMVDAGMRELNQSGYMHNRVRMITASFLSKHLLVDWRWGEAYFARKLLDFELASNNGGWQWAAGCGTDAAPYFRIFNPHAQLKKFDKNLHYVKKFVPEYGTDNYPDPIVDHKLARERCLRVYKEALDS